MHVKSESESKKGWFKYIRSLGQGAIRTKYGNNFGSLDGRRFPIHFGSLDEPISEYNSVPIHIRL